MAITPAQIAAAQAVQHAAAQDPSQRVRLVAGPGTGKSSAIEERVRWLLDQHVQPRCIYVVSFTRASALDLLRRIQKHCTDAGFPAVAQVRVSTLHSLALRTLRAAGQLNAYPADPSVLDKWEVEHIFDAEFGHLTGIRKKRREKIRAAREAFWYTGQPLPPNYIVPNPPISDAERQQFEQFHGPRTQSYSCVLPGEIIRQCVEQIEAGVLDATQLLDCKHLIVDEYQDLNPMDLRFVDKMADQGAIVFVAGDDDQSIYSFRYASPAGIQEFSTKYPGCGEHMLDLCFRCTPDILAAGANLIAANAMPARIPKHLVSLYAGAAPPLSGVMHRWRFANGDAEATAVAESCRDLIAAGIEARDILVLLSDTRILLRRLNDEFAAAGVEIEPPRAEGFLHSPSGRLVLTVLRIVCNGDNYVAHRVILGLLHGVGIGTCAAITDAVIQHNLPDYRSIFYDPLPGGVFDRRSLTALGQARALCQQIAGWQSDNTLAQRAADIGAIITGPFGAADSQDWQAYAATLPQDMTLEELMNYLWADTDEQQARVLEGVLTRLQQPIPDEGLLPQRVRVMTMHGAKGLSAKIVFIPGLEEDILPGQHRRRSPGLVLEAARLLYVSITRARAACIVSHAQYRSIQGQYERRAPSRFVPHLAGPFRTRGGGLRAAEIDEIADVIGEL